MKPTEPLRRRVYQAIRDDAHPTKLNIALAALDVLLILRAGVFVVLDSFTLPPGYHRLSLWVDLFTIGVFTVEYLLRLWTAPERQPGLSPARARLAYAFSFTGVVDFLAAGPYYLLLPFARYWGTTHTRQVLRLFMVLKINRYTHSFDQIVTVLRRKGRELLSSLIALFILMLIFSVMIYNFESPLQPDKFTSPFSGMWWAIVTVATIGYGDLVPVTVGGRILGSILAILGVALVAVPTGIISAGFVEVLNEQRAGKPAAPPASAAGEIAAFKALLDSGAITPEEFAEHKAFLLRKARGEGGEGTGLPPASGTGLPPGE